MLLDERIHSAPRINDVISDVGTIEGDFTREEVDELVSVLNAGALVVPIKPDPISEATVDPTLGYDVRQKGILAIQIAAVAVVVFMLLYYRVAGFVAVLCLALNLALVLGTMVLINATFSLPGLAGLVLTIGMAVDANVLIFERIREETARGSSLRMAIKNGFGRAFTTIVDANVTTLITAVILYMIGTDQVKGFAVTLFIGIVMSMFTSLYVGRLVFDVCEKKRWIRTLNMSRIVGQTNWDFVGRRRLAAIVSALLIVIGLAGFFKRGTENYDIDFTGGTMVTFQFTEDHELEDVKQRLSSMPFFGAAVTVERLTLAGDPEGSKGRHFRVRTTQRDADQTSGNVEDTVLAKINEAFAGDPAFQLLKITMDYGEILEIVSASGAEDSADSTTDATDTESADDGKVDVAREVEITFTDEVAEATIIDAIAEAVADASDVPFSDPETLFEVDGLEGSGVGAEETDVRRFSKVRLRADPSVRKTDFESALTSMQATMAARPHFDEVNSFASSVAREMKQSAVMAIVISLIAIVAYVWFRFQRITFGLAAVAALVHDVLVVLGMVALAAFLSGTPLGPVLLLNDFKINLPMIAAFLTIVGYSLNDTIVVFDRIREVRGKNPAMTEAIVNTSLNQTLARTVLTSITTFLVVAILYSIGGEGIHGFAFCLVLGVIVGTYSSIYVASPVLLWLMNRPTAASRGSGGASRAAAAL